MRIRVAQERGAAQPARGGGLVLFDTQACRQHQGVIVLRRRHALFTGAAIKKGSLGDIGVGPPSLTQHIGQIELGAAVTLVGGQPVQFHGADVIAFDATTGFTKRP